MVSSSFDNNGVKVMATMRETNRETINDIPRGCNIRPSIPERKNRGRNATMIIKVALKMEALISLDASYTTVKEDCRFSGDFWWFCRSRLYTFSTSIIASSTNEPMAMAMPPRLIVLMFKPSAFITRIAPSNDKGIATREIIVVRKFPKNINKIIITKILPSIKAFCTLLMEVSIKSA